MRFSSGGQGGIWGGGGVYNSADVIITDEWISDDTDTAIYVIPRQSGEGSDRTATEGNYYLSETEYANLTKVAGSYENVIVVFNIGGIIDMKWFDEINAEIPDGLDAVLIMSQAGQQGGPALVQIMNGEVTPSGKLTDTWAINYEDYPSSATFSSNDGDTVNEIYEESIYNGYRYFDTFGLDVAYPFGYGLSYTDFDIEVIDVNADSLYTTVQARVTNIGDTYSGKEVVEVYFSAPQGPRLDKPYQELAGYAKTETLAPGASQVLTVSFPTTEMSSYDEDLAAYIMEDGDYIIRVGNSSRNTKIAAVLTLDSGEAGYQITEQLSNQLPTVADDETKPNNNYTGYIGEDLLTSWDAPGPIFDTESTYDAVAELDLDFSDYNVPNNASPYDTQVTTTLISESNKENYENGMFWDDEIKTYADTDSVVKGHDEVVKYVDDVPEGTKLTDVIKGKVTLEEFVASLTLEQISYITEGYGSAASESKTTLAFGSAGFTTSRYEDELGIPAMALPDGPAGLRISQVTQRDGVTYYQYATAIPIGTCYAQAWDVDVCYFAGGVIGEEMNQFGATYWLAPGMNIHRNPLCGRNFEYYSEDPVVTGLCAAYVTRGVQSFPGVSVTLKHYIANQQENARMSENSSATERTLREIYLKAFEMAVKGGRPAGIMTSYNKINGVWASTLYDLNTDIPRGEWGYNGLIMTDWGGVHTDISTINSGNDLVTPGGAGATVYNSLRKVDPSIDPETGALNTGTTFSLNADGDETISTGRLPATTAIPEAVYKTTVSQSWWGTRETPSYIKAGTAVVTYYEDENDTEGTARPNVEPDEEDTFDTSAYEFVEIVYRGVTNDTTHVHVGDIQLGAMNIIRMAMNSIQMEDLYDDVTVLPYNDFFNSPISQSVQTFESPLTDEDNLIDYVKIEKSAIEYGEVEAPETAGVNETFSIDITTGADVIGFLLQNESGKKITIKSITSEVNEEGNIEWTIETAIGTAGSRELSLIPVSATSGAYGAIPVAIEITDNYEPYSVIAAGFAQNAATVNAPVELDVLTGPGSSIIKVQSETGRNMGKTLVSRTANTDGSIAWTYEMSIGTAGQRVFDVYVSHDGALSEPVQADIIIV